MNSDRDHDFALRIEGMDCGACAQTIEKGVGQLQGVQAVEVSFPTESLRVRGPVDRDAVVRKVTALGYRVVERPEPGSTAGEALSLWGYLSDLRSLQALLGAGLLLLLTAPWAQHWAHHTAQFVLAGLAAAPVGLKGLRALLGARSVTIDLLVVLATAGAVAIGEVGEAAAVAVLYTLGEALEGYGVARARRALSGLLASTPQRATVLRSVCTRDEPHDHDHSHNDADGERHALDVDASDVRIGDQMLVRPGERVPVDGFVVRGQSSVNQAPITGESTPLRRGVGDRVLAGSVNGEEALEVEATAIAAGSTLQRVAQLVQDAQRSRAPAERAIDRFAAWYTPVVVLMSALVAFAPPLLWGAPLWDPAGGEGWLYRGLTLLIVACPCALVISIPVTVVSALSGLSRMGALVKGGAYLDRLASIRVFAFDKTGTLTEGRPVVTRARAVDCADNHSPQVCGACDDLVAVASAVEQGTSHPLAHAVMSEAQSRSLVDRYGTAQSVTSLAGRGVRGELGESTVTVGSHALFHEDGALACQLHPYIESAESEGETVMLVARDGEMLGYIAAADRPRAAAARMLNALKLELPELRTVMLTGDNEGAAHGMAGRVPGLDEVRAGLLPDEKLDAVRALQKDFGPVAMVGDGINDTPAMAAADVSVAMGAAGTAQALETADVVLMDSSLDQLPALVRSAKRMRRIVRENVALSLGLKLAFVGLALAGVASLWVAVLADVGASLLVTLNGMRMLEVDPR